MESPEAAPINHYAGVRFISPADDDSPAYEAWWLCESRDDAVREASAWMPYLRASAEAIPLPLPDPPPPPDWVFAGATVRSETAYSVHMVRGLNQD